MSLLNLWWVSCYGVIEQILTFYERKCMYCYLKKPNALPFLTCYTWNDCRSFWIVPEILSPSTEMSTSLRSVLLLVARALFLLISGTLKKIFQPVSSIINNTFYWNVAEPLINLQSWLKAQEHNFMKFSLPIIYGVFVTFTFSLFFFSFFMNLCEWLANLRKVQIINDYESWTVKASIVAE